MGTGGMMMVMVMVMVVTHGNNHGVRMGGGVEVFSTASTTERWLRTVSAMARLAVRPGLSMPYNATSDVVDDGFVWVEMTKSLMALLLWSTAFGRIPA